MHSVGCPLHVHVLGLFKPFNPLPNPQNEPPGGGGGGVAGKNGYNEAQRQSAHVLLHGWI